MYPNILLEGTWWVVLYTACVIPSFSDQGIPHMEALVIFSLWWCLLHNEADHCQDNSLGFVGKCDVMGIPSSFYANTFFSLAPTGPY